MASLSSRRTFLKQTGSALLASGFAPSILRGESKSGSGPAIVGEGDWKFECHHNWGQLPDSIRWRNTHGVAIGKDGTVYITHQGDEKAPCDTVVVFDPQGKFIRSFGAEFAGGNHGIDIREEWGVEYLYCSVTAPHRVVVKYDTKGELVWRQPAPEKAGVYDDRNFFSPTNVCFGPSNELYVGDGYGSHYLHQYDKDGVWVRTWGGLGDKVGQFKTPHGQWMDNRDPAQPKIVVADRANARLQFFSLDLKPLNVVQGVPIEQKELNGMVGEQKTVNDESVPSVSVYGISYPSAIDSQGEFLVIADLHARVSILNGKNELVANLGFNEGWTTQVLDGRPYKMRAQPKTWKDGRFIHPHDATFDAKGNLFVTEWVEQGRVSFLRRV